MTRRRRRGGLPGRGHRRARGGRAPPRRIRPGLNRPGPGPFYPAVRRLGSPVLVARARFIARNSGKSQTGFSQAWVPCPPLSLPVPPCPSLSLRAFGARSFAACLSLSLRALGARSFAEPMPKQRQTQNHTAARRGCNGSTPASPRRSSASISCRTGNSSSSCRLLQRKLGQRLRPRTPQRQPHRPTTWPPQLPQL